MFKEYKSPQIINVYKDSIIKYGIIDKYIDVTHIAHEKCLNDNNRIIIPSGDHARADIFTDPIPYIEKSIFIDTRNREHNKNRLKNMQNNLKIEHGSFDEEYPEQLNIITYLTGNEKVLEIGGNIGRSSLIIASVLEDSRNLLTLECDIHIAEKLKQNRDINNLYFNIEAKALSNRPLFQKYWNTTPITDDSPPNVENITLNEIREKYNIDFDTLVLDCEGAFYYILVDMPDILHNIQLIIVENDYKEISHKIYVENILKDNNFKAIYSSDIMWLCNGDFYQVWKRY
jgi:FkbM family methyltransferase